MTHGSHATLSPSAALEDAPTTLFDDEEPTGDAEPRTELDPTDPWKAIGVDLGDGLLAQYRLIQVIAKDGPVAAYLAEHMFLDRRVLVKVLTSASDREGARAFLAEATALWQLGHPGFPAVLEYGTDVGGRPFVIMEFSAGANLTERMQVSALPAAFALDVGEQIAAAMTTAHARGVAHGALSTDAIYLCQESALRHGVRVKIADFAAGVPTAGFDSTAQEVERAVRAARPEDDLAALGELLAHLGEAVEPGGLPGPIAQALSDLCAALRMGERGLTMVDVARELHRLGLELGMAPHVTRTGVVGPPRVVSSISLWQGAAVFVGAIALAAVLGALL